jgi:sigma 54 modulation/S30EA-like ribosomal protein
MTPTADITYRNMACSQWLDTEIQKRAAKLATFCPDILSCKVLIEIPHRHHEQGNRFHIRIDIKVPGEMIVAGQAPNLHLGHFDGEVPRERRSTKIVVRKDASLAVRQAFDAAKRQLRDYVRVRRSDVKSHTNGREANAPA